MIAVIGSDALAGFTLRPTYSALKSAAHASMAELMTIGTERIERHVTGLSHALASGMLDLVRARWQEQPPPSPDEVTRAFWHACRAAQRNTAAFLVERGADPDWVGWDHKTPRQVARESGDSDFIAWLDQATAR